MIRRKEIEYLLSLYYNYIISQNLIEQKPQLCLTRAQVGRIEIESSKF
jgi:hypothetical protein